MVRCSEIGDRAKVAEELKQAGRQVLFESLWSRNWQCDEQCIRGAFVSWSITELFTRNFFSQALAT